MGVRFVVSEVPLYLEIEICYRSVGIAVPSTRSIAWVSLGRNLDRIVSDFAPRNALKLIAPCELTFSETLVLHDLTCDETFVLHQNEPQESEEVMAASFAPVHIACAPRRIPWRILKLRAVPIGTVLHLETTTLQKFEAVPWRVRIEGS